MADRLPQLEQEPAVLEQRAPTGAPPRLVRTEQRAPAGAPPRLVRTVVQEAAQQPGREHQHAAERRPVEVDRLEQEQPGQEEGPGQSVGWRGPQRAPPVELGVAAAQRRLATERPQGAPWWQCGAPAQQDLEEENPESLWAHWWGQC